MKKATQKIQLPNSQKQHNSSQSLKSQSLQRLHDQLLMAKTEGNKKLQEMLKAIINRIESIKS
jgi:hypothetical protein